MTEQTTWFPIPGFEGIYEMTADGAKVRSLPRKRTFGNSDRMVKGKQLTMNKDGGYRLTNPRNAITSKWTPERLRTLLNSRKGNADES